MKNLILSAALMSSLTVSAAGLDNYQFDENGVPSLRHMAVTGTVIMPPEGCSGVLTIDRSPYPDKPLKTGRLAFELAKKGDDMLYHTGYVGELTDKDDELVMSLVNFEYSADNGLDNPEVVAYARNENDNWREYYHGYVDTDACGVHLVVSQDERHD